MTPLTASAPVHVAAAWDTAEVARYRRDGAIVVPRLFAAEDLTRAHDAIAELTRSARAPGADHAAILEFEPEPVDGQQVPRRIYDPFLQHQAFRALATDARVLDRVESLIGPDIAIQHSKLNMKCARVGSSVEWHQDLTYFPHTNSDLVTVLIYLDDATEENGCLQVLPGQHHHFFDHTRADGTFAGMIAEDLSGCGTPVPLPAPAGSAIFMHCLTPHSSLTNRSDQARRTLIFEYRAADAFPIWFGDGVTASERKTCHLRGSPARTARFGGPPPPIPRFPSTMPSLYEVQRQTKSLPRS
ncbi:MAG: phytanoyl-CoA dioxygenase family protein [Planctomycetes bacterium]|nr:phytanoyl-CoA dioxygenase family protein [Planctomycetota bacterium]